MKLKRTIGQGQVKFVLLIDPESVDKMEVHSSGNLSNHHVKPKWEAFFPSADGLIYKSGTINVHFDEWSELELIETRLLKVSEYFMYQNYLKEIEKAKEVSALEFNQILDKLNNDNSKVSDI